MISAFFLTLNSFHRKRFALYSSASRRFHSYDVKKKQIFWKNYFKFSWILKNDSKRHLSVQIDTIRLFFFSLFARPSHSNSTFFLFHMIFKCQILSSRNLWKKKIKNWQKTPKKLKSPELLHLAKLLVCYCSVHQKRFI